MKVLLVISAFNEEENIVRVCGNLRENYSEYDFIVVNDGSSDDTLKLCQENSFPVLNLPVNLGLAGAFQAGMKYAYEHDYDCAIQFDADGQHRPEYVKNMIEKLDSENNIIIASRFKEEKKPHSMRMLGSRMIAAAIRLTTGKKLTDPTSGMRAFDKRMIKEFAGKLNYGPEPDTVSYLMKQGIRISEVQAQMDERVAGESYLNFTKSIEYMLRMMVSILIIQNFRNRVN